MKKILKSILVFVITITMLLSNLQGAVGVKATLVDKKEVVQTPMNNEMEIKGSNSFGNLISELLQEETTEISQEYYISDVIVEENKVTVDYNILKECTLAVAIYDESGMQMIDFGKIEVTADTSQTTIQLEETLPEYFLVKCFLLDSENYTPLSSVYTNDHYTQEFQEFLAKTTADFNAEDVMNLDNDPTTNFAIFDEGTVRVEAGGDEQNVIDASGMAENIYIINNADDTVKNLKVGEVLYYKNDSSDFMLKIQSVIVDADKVTIVAEDAEIEEVFSYVKIETNMEDAEVNVDNSKLEQGVTYLGIPEEQTFARGAEFESSADYTFKIGRYALDKKEGEIDVSESSKIKGEVKGEIDLSIKSELKLYVNEEKVDVSFTITPIAEANLEFSGEADFVTYLGKEITVRPVAGVLIGFTPGFRFKTEGKLSFSASIEVQLGAGWTSTEGIVNRCKKPEVFVGYEIEGSIYIGFVMVPRVKVISDKLIELSLDLNSGAEIKGTMKSDLTGESDKKHECLNCIDGAITAKFNVSFSIKSDLLKEADVSDKVDILEGKLNVTVCSVSYKVTDFYYSITKNKGGKGNCPYIKYKVKISVYDKDGNAVSGQTVYLKDDQVVSTNSSGKAEVYLNNGSYYAMIKDSESDATKSSTFTVEDGSISVVLVASWEKKEEKEDEREVFDPTAHGEEIETGTCGDGVNWILYEGGMLYIYGEGEIWGAAFKNTDKDIKNVYIETGIAGIGRWAFYRCSSLVSVSIPSSVLSIGNHTFSLCNNLINIELPSGLTSIESSTFQGCSSLKNISIPSGVTSIDINAFYECKNLTSVEMPSSLINIGISAFEDCDNLVNVEMSSDVKSLGERAFYGCDNLMSINIPSSVTSIGSGAFAGCDNLIDIEIPSNVSSIEDYTFTGCNNLTTVSIEAGVTTIGDAVFAYCKNLTSIEIPSSVTSIGEKVFSLCNNVTIYAPSGSYAQTFAEENDILFVATDMELAQGIECTPLQAIEVQAITQSSEANTITKSDAVPRANYIFMVVMDENAEDILSAENLIYIDEKTASEKGSITFTYQTREEFEDAKTMFVGQKIYDYSRLNSILSDCENNTYTKNSQNEAKLELTKALKLVLGWEYARSQKEVDELAESLSKILRTEDVVNPNEKNPEPNPPADLGETVNPSVSDISVDKLPVVGSIIEDRKTDAVYKVLVKGKNVAYVKPLNKKTKKISIASTVKLNGITYKVTSIKANALKSCKKLTTLTIGKNVISIGKKAFNGCKNLKKITIQSKQLKIVGKKVFKGIHKKAKIKVPANKLKAYKKLLKGKGQSKEVKITK